MPTYFRGVLGQLAHLNCTFQTAAVEIDRVQPAVRSTIDLLSAWYGEVDTEGSPRVSAAEKAFLSSYGFCYGDKFLSLEVFPHAPDSKEELVTANLKSNIALQRALMVQHAGHVVTALKAHSPNLTLLVTLGRAELDTLLKHYGKEKHFEDGRTSLVLVDKEKAVDEFERFKTYVHTTYAEVK
ncbi:hypothetical protein CYMTET_22424 [Cymbomonas tetramitiformis]|uniref:Uncharacterized protein n=1 Tax=Cymbomonas tetramitiformis TaxID=36881 RepID=A0AAE0G011_9CHLO|nr:hypothetical protein CYMTET_22424 [Cymbomonas tetramitiformis]